MNKNIYCTLDTETVGGSSNPTGMYNAGAVIHDKDGNILATTSILIMEHYDNINKDDYAKKHFPVYEARLINGTISAVTTEAEAVSIVRNLCRFYGVKYVMAYNSCFDFIKTPFAALLDEFEFIDLYLMALQTITNSAMNMVCVLRMAVGLAQQVLKRSMPTSPETPTLKKNTPRFLTH